MFKLIIILACLSVVFLAEATYKPVPHIIYPTYRPPPRRPEIIRIAREAGEPQWLFKGIYHDIPRAPATGDHPLLPSYIDDIKLDPNRRTARSLSTPRASRGEGTRQTSSRDTGPTHPGYNRRNVRDIRLASQEQFQQLASQEQLRTKRGIESLARQEEFGHLASQEQLRTKRGIESLDSQEQLASQEQLRTKRGIESLASQEQFGQLASQEQLRTKRGIESLASQEQFGQLASQEQLRTKRGIESLASQEQFGQLASQEQLRTNRGIESLASQEQFVKIDG